MSHNVVNELIEYLNKPRELFAKLEGIRYSDNRRLTGDKAGIEKIKPVVIELNKTHNVDICHLAVAAVNAGYGAHSIKYIVQDAIPFLTLNLDTLVEFLRIAKLIELQPIKQLVIEQPKFSEQLLAKLIDLADSTTASLVPLIINTKESLSINQKHQKLFSLLRNSKIPLIKVAIIGLADLQYNIKADQSLLKLTIEKLDELIVHDNSEVVKAAVWSMCKLICFSDEIKTKILNLAQKQNPIYSLEIAIFIFHYPEYIDNSQWFKSLLMTYAKVPYENEGLIRHVDLILSNVFENTATQQLAELFWVSWLSINYNQIGNHRIEKVFGSTLSILVKRQQNLISLITRYINHDNEYVVQTAFKVIKYAQSYRKIKPSLDHSTLQSFTQEELLYVCRKILGYVYLAEILQHLFYSMLTAMIKNNEAVELVVSIFISYIAKEYPTSTLAFLKDKITNDEQTRELNEVILQIIEIVKSNSAPRNDLPRLNELSIANKQRYQIQLAKQKYMNQAMEQPQEGSFLACVTQINLKYGKGCFNRFGGQYNQPSMLSSHSHSIEIPTSESYHPVHAAIHSNNDRHVKKGQ